MRLMAEDQILLIEAGASELEMSTRDELLASVSIPSPSEQPIIPPPMESPAMPPDQPEVTPVRDPEPTSPAPMQDPSPIEAPRQASAVAGDAWATLLLAPAGFVAAYWRALSAALKR